MNSPLNRPTLKKTDVFCNHVGRFLFTLLNYHFMALLILTTHTSCLHFFTSEKPVPKQIEALGIDLSFITN